MSTIEILRLRHVQLAYHVLAHLDLGDDAASLYDPSLPRRPWITSLTRAYQAAEGRLVLQGAPLAAPDLDALRAGLEGGERLGGGAANATLAQRFVEALDAERPRLDRSFDPRRRAGLLAGRDRWLRRRLPRLRAAMQELFGDPADEPAALQLVDCPALRIGRWTRGRALTAGGDARIVAAALDVPAEHALCQIVHEELHAFTDPERPASGRDTRASSSGFTLHRELETRAVDAGQRLIAQRAPELLPAYSRWRTRHGC